MTTWPAASKATTTHTDSGTDKPRLARVDINQNILNVNDVIDMFNISSPVDGQILQYNTANARFELSSDFVGQGLTISGNTISSNRSDDDIVFEPSGVGAVRFPAVTINDNSITGTRSNEDLTISASGTGNLILFGSVTLQGLTISQNNITASRSNDDLVLNSSGTGNVNIKGNLNFSKNYIESISTLTSSDTVTVDCNVASVFKITLSHNVTFVISNLVAGQSVSLIIKQNDTNLKDPLFVQADGSTKVLFADGVDQISQTLDRITVVNIFNTGSEHLAVLTNNFTAPG
jgi:hypothetical protein